MERSKRGNRPDLCGSASNSRAGLAELVKSIDRNS